MKKLAILFSFFLLLSACAGSDPSEGEIEGIFLSENVVEAGQNTITSVTFRVAATKINSEYISEPLWVLVNLPIGVEYIPGSSEIGFQGPREPDAVGRCPNLTTYVAFNLRKGEIEDPFNFDSFSSVINFVVTVRQAGSEGEAFGASGPGSNDFSDPCNVVFTEDVKYHVS